MVLDQSWPVCLPALRLISKFSNTWNIGWIQCSDGVGPLSKVLFQLCLHWKPQILSSPLDCFLHFLNKSIKCVLLHHWDPNGNFHFQKAKRNLKFIVGDYIHRALGFLGCSYAIWLWRCCVAIVGFRIENCCWLLNRNRWTQCSFMESYCTALGTRIILFVYFVYLCSTWKSALAHDWISWAQSQCDA